MIKEIIKTAAAIVLAVIVVGAIKSCIEDKKTLPNNSSPPTESVELFYDYNEEIFRDS